MANPGGFISVLFAFIAFLIVVLIFYKNLFLNMDSSHIGGILILVIIAIVLIYNVILAKLICSKDTDTFYKESAISIIFPIVAILIASIDKCRIPIASILQSLTDEQTESPEKTVGGRRNKIKGGDCCEKQIALSDIENEHPSIKGAGYGFYIFFGMLYAITYSNSVLSC
jgi:hypothetical protein